MKNYMAEAPAAGAPEEEKKDEGEKDDPAL